MNIDETINRINKDLNINFPIELNDNDFLKMVLKYNSELSDYEQGHLIFEQTLGQYGYSYNDMPVYEYQEIV